jgi:hypothetical protein
VFGSKARRGCQTLEITVDGDEAVAYACVGNVVNGTF